MKTGEVVRKNFSSLSAVYWDAAAAGKAGGSRSGRMCWINPVPLCPQACYGILKVPIGSWLCRTCALGVQPKCLLCPKRGGALKPTRSGTKWVHVSCALWIPEVRGLPAPPDTWVGTGRSQVLAQGVL